MTILGSTLYCYRKRVEMMNQVSRTDAGSNTQLDEMVMSGYDRYQVEGLVLQLNKILLNFFRDGSFSNIVPRGCDVSHAFKVAERQIQFLKSFQDEYKVMNEVWRRHLELLFVHDEISQVQSSIQLATVEDVMSAPEVFLSLSLPPPI